MSTVLRRAAPGLRGHRDARHLSNGGDCRHSDNRSGALVPASTTGPASRPPRIRNRWSCCTAWAATAPATTRSSGPYLAAQGLLRLHLDLRPGDSGPSGRRHRLDHPVGRAGIEAVHRSGPDRGPAPPRWTSSATRRAASTASTARRSAGTPAKVAKVVALAPPTHQVPRSAVSVSVGDYLGLRPFLSTRYCANFGCPACDQIIVGGSEVAGS